MKKLVFVLLLGMGSSGLSCAAPVTPEAVMAFESLKDPAISDDGSVIAYAVQADRGEPNGRLRRPDGHVFNVVGAQAPVLSSDGDHALFTVPPSLLEWEQTPKKARRKLHSGRVLVHSRTGQEWRFDEVKEAKFSHNGRYLLVLHEKAKATDETPVAGATLTIRDLHKDTSRTFSHVHQIAVAEKGFGLAYSSETPAGELNGVYLLSHDLSSVPVYQEKGHVSGALRFSRDGKQLAFSWGPEEVAKRQREHRLGHFQGGKLRWQALNHADFIVSGFSELTFSRDGERLFVGRQARQPQSRKIEDYADPTALYQPEQILSRTELVLWHGDDARIKSVEQKRHKDEFKRQYQGVWHLSGEEFIQLTDPRVPSLKLADNRRFLLASSDTLYRKMASWAGFYRDWYLVDLKTGQRRALVEQTLSADEPSLSPHDDGVIWHVRGKLKWHDIKANSTRVIAEGFSDEDHDYPSPAPGYGFDAWLEPGAGVLVYDKYDIWLAKGGELERLTEGRAQRWIHRRVRTDDDALFLSSQADLLLHRHNEHTRDEGLSHLKIAPRQLQPWLTGPQRTRFVAKAQQSDVLLFTQERYDRYPDLLQTRGWQGEFTQVSDLGAQLETLDWGQAQRISWRSRTGEPLSGVLITPPGYQGDKPLPTMIYFYRFMSDRLHQFPAMALNHRPNFPWFASKGYAIFLPDIRFEIGHPGRSTADALLPGLDTLVEMGLTDPHAVGLQGHSWAGYQSAQLVTQTNRFKAVVTGAPVANMTSAYTGIRLGSGLGRQFQYEAGQSRIGQSLYRAPQLYIENSPVFHADKIETPMLIMFGDKDDAVPWQQGIELYLAMRRLGKEVVMLQYEGEPHHLKEYHNKLDYSLKMMAFFDHTLQGAAAPSWWLQGQPLRLPDPEEQ
ncbi:alpha/beta hydrolase family protein [Ferrimonas pelagia]|uniref:Prolyl oligopeptidase family serine peptidase n=1 Tax=Ferrimonas pelagia TaxID=1177826 RepID=A0ABP9FF93_9GAMM